MRTSEGLSEVVGAGSVLTSLILFTLIYIALLVIFLLLLDMKIRSGPGSGQPNVERGRA